MWRRPGVERSAAAMALWAQLPIPVTVLNNGPGRTALVMAGNHGDEYPGQVAILKLARELVPEQVRGDHGVGLGQLP